MCSLLLHSFFVVEHVYFTFLCQSKAAMGTVLLWLYNDRCTKRLQLWQASHTLMLHAHMHYLKLKLKKRSGSVVRFKFLKKRAAMASKWAQKIVATESLYYTCISRNNTTFASATTLQSSEASTRLLGHIISDTSMETMALPLTQQLTLPHGVRATSACRTNCRINLLIQIRACFSLEKSVFYFRG